MSKGRSVVLIYPYEITGWQAQPWRDLPLGILSVAAPLVRLGYSVRVIDQRTSPSWNSILKAELEGDPICVGISSTTGPQLKYALEATRFVKQHSPVPVVWGGVHASLLPEQTLKKNEIDYVVQGEGEITFKELVQALEKGSEVSGIAGLWYKENGKICRSSPRPFVDLNEQPPPAYDLVDISQYERTVFGVNRLSFSTSRGCTYPCAFCYNTSFNRRQWRALKAETVLEQIKDFVRRYSVRGLFLTDANFFLDMDRAREILEGTVRARLGLVFTRLHIRFDQWTRLTDEDFRLLEKAGCKCLAIGVESGSDRIRNLLRKPIDASLLREMNRKVKQHPIVPLYFFMMGFPTESVNELKETVELYSNLLRDNPRAIKSINIYTPFPGTELFDLAVAEGFKPPEELEDWCSYSYRSMGAHSGWRSSRIRKLIEMLDFCSFFVGGNSYLTPIKKTNPAVVGLARLYAPIARQRVKHFIYQFPLEIRLARKLGLYARQQ